MEAVTGHRSAMPWAWHLGRSVSVARGSHRRAPECDAAGLGREREANAPGERRVKDEEGEPA